MASRESFMSTIFLLLASVLPRLQVYSFRVTLTCDPDCGPQG
ncbi:hypothetical protein EE612_053322 [Oryza sativa]|nr:hypothetical protein EE612_053322 [Oryza sativa]